MRLHMSLAPRLPKQRGISLVLVALLASVAFATPARAQQDSPKAPTFDFLRSTQAGGLSVLQTRTVAYQRPGGGPTILLVGVAHLGTPEYYATLQKRLDAQTVVLFEGVHEKNMKMGKGAATIQGGVQPELAKGLGLVFQLDAIDYSRPNFIGSDMTWNGLQSAYGATADAPEAGDDTSSSDTPTETAGGHAPAKGSGKPATKNQNLMNQLTDAMSGNGAAAGMIQQFSGLMSGSPQLQETMKMVIIQAMGQAAELLNLAQNESPDMKHLLTVLLTQRNAIVMRDLRMQLQHLKPGQSVALFYGAAHMNELSQRIQSELGYQSVRETWDTAFSADPAKSMFTQEQIAMMVQMAKTQLQAPTSTGGDDAFGLKDLQQLIQQASPSPH